MWVRRSSALGDAERQGHATIAVAHRAALHDRIVAVGGCEHVSHPAAGEERRRVVARHTGVRSTHAVAVAACIYERRVSLAELVGVEAESAQRVGPQAREEHVSALEELVEHTLTVVGAQVEGDGALAAIGERDRQVDPARARADALRHQPAVRVALWSIDTNDVGAPIGQQRTGDGDEHPLGELDDPHALKGTDHLTLSHHISHRVGGAVSHGRRGRG